MSKRIRGIFILSGIIILPLAFSIFFATGTSQYQELPKHINLGKVDTNGDSVYLNLYDSIPDDYTFTNQNGETVRVADFKGDINVIQFFFTTCTTICPAITGNVADADTALSQAGDVNILSFTVDPAQDSVEALKAYVERYGGGSDRWQLMTGKKKEIYRLARKGLALGVGEVAEGDKSPDSEDDFFHTEMLTLVDKEGYIRGFYPGTNPAQVERLVQEVVVLRQEYERNTKQ